VCKNLIKSCRIFHLAGIVTVFEFLNVLVYMFFGYMMKVTDDAKLQRGPETFCAVCMSNTVDVLLFAVYYNVMRFELIGKVFLGSEFIGHENGGRINVFADNWFKRFTVRMRNRLRSYISIPFKHTENGGFVGLHITAPLSVGLAAYKSFVYFNRAIKRFVKCRRFHGKSNPMEHEPRSLLSNTNIAAHLQGRNTFFMAGDQPQGHIPLNEREGGIFKDRPNSNAKRFSAIGTFKLHAVLDTVNFTGRSAMNADRLVTPTGKSKLINAGYFGRISFLQVKEALKFNNISHVMPALSC
jgi:hypothetical protein